MDARQWFREAKFGLMVHWGLYSLPAGEWKGQRMTYIGEWIQSRFRIPNAEYHALARAFNPILFDADEWVRLAQDAGMQYIVVTHGGVVAQAVADAGIDEAVRLERVHHVGQLAALRGGDGHGRVEPDQAQVAVVGQQLAHLGLDLFLEAL